MFKMIFVVLFRLCPYPIVLIIYILIESVVSIDVQNINIQSFIITL